MSKRGIIGRVTQLARANISSMLDSAGDPEEMLDQLLREYTVTISAAEEAIAQLIGNLRIAGDDQAQDAQVIAQWNDKAAAVSQTADELRAAGIAAEADRFDILARIALERQLTAESDVRSVQHTMDAQLESVGRLSNGLGQLRALRAPPGPASPLAGRTGLRSVLPRGPAPPGAVRAVRAAAPAGRPARPGR